MDELKHHDAESFIEAFRLASFEQQFERLKEGFGKAQGQLRIAAPGFNVFQLLKIGRREVKTHSAFLADLLDPAGSHGQGFLFLWSFWRYCEIKETVPIWTEDCQITSEPFPRIEGDIEAHNWEIIKEKRTPRHGQMDIVLHCPTLKMLCVIENKVEADEGKRQLKKYWEWMQTEKNIDHKALIFLTPEGRDSQTAGCIPYFNLSYHKDIYEWLAAAGAEIDALPVAAVVEQYSHLVLSL